MGIWKTKWHEEKEIHTISHVQVESGSYNVPLLQFFGSILVTGQYAVITEVTNTSNMTDVYADIWDGINSKILTKASPGADFSGMLEASLFSRLGDELQNYTLLNTDENRYLNYDKKLIGSPFIITAKDGVNNFIRFNFTTNTTLDFKMEIFFFFQRINGSRIWFI